MRTYRNIYINGTGIKSFNGQADVYYTGHIFTNAARIKDFSRMYDPGQDLYITCGTCAGKKYRRFIKTK